MSQAKVDKYKQNKANRKEIIAKEKRQKMITKVCFSVVGAVLVAWVGVSAVFAIIDARPVHTIFANVDSIDDYLSALYPEETETESETGTEEGTEEGTEASTEESK